ncbi:MAG TPA: hypothetical protein DEP69_01085, partial [Acidimicrobiaceae bacterium]|nr:hypothetical protein [Acidimicrobiaceae bacterium]
MADAEPADLVTADLVVDQLAEQVAERVLADAPKRPRRQLQTAGLVGRQAALLEQACHLAEAFDRLGRLVAEQTPHPVRVDLGQGARVHRPRQHLRQVVQVAETAHHVGGLRHRQRVVAAEVVVAVPAHLRERLLEVLRQLLHLPAQVDVGHQLLGEVGEPAALLGRHRVEHRLHRRHALGHVLEQLVERP